ncbi:MAG TPA: DUF4864 domain-containing protein [Opitutaceae bacterium]
MIPSGRFLGLGLTLVLWLSGTLLIAAEPALRPSRPDVKAAMETIVSAQLTAWREDRPADAYACASASIRAQFPLEAFVVMVRRGYPEIAANRRAEFSLARDNGVTGEVSVRVTPAEGSPVRYRYLLIREDAGWRINGVVADTRRRDEV